MTHLNIEKLELASRDREKEEQKKMLRKKNILLLINHYLEENGLVQTANALKLESNFSIQDYDISDNIHLEIIVQDFESYYYLRYQKLPNISKKVPGNRKSVICNKSKFNRIKSASKCVTSAQKCSMSYEDKDYAQHNSIKDDNNLLKCDSYNFSDSSFVEWQYLCTLIMQDFNVKKHIIQWCDIIGLEKAKQTIKEAIIFPLKYKELFCLSIVPWKSILLYGPTGTGKTSLAFAAASESKVSFFNVSVSTLTSKWRGESEKLVRVLFYLAKQYAPSIIYIDEIDSLVSHRGNDHEASRRMKTEFFFQIDAISPSDNVFVLASTNIPWELDHAILRRMEKRLFIPLPDFESRISLYKKFLPSNIKLSKDLTANTNLNYENLSTVSENYSAADVELVCKEAKMTLIREVLNKLENSGVQCSNKHLNIKTLETCDVLSVLDNIKPSNNKLAEKYNIWKEKFCSE